MLHHSLELFHPRNETLSIFRRRYLSITRDWYLSTQRTRLLQGFLSLKQKILKADNPVESFRAKTTNTARIFALTLQSNYAVGWIEFPVLLLWTFKVSRGVPLLFENKFDLIFIYCFPVPLSKSLTFVESRNIKSFKRIFPPNLPIKKVYNWSDVWTRNI